MLLVICNGVSGVFSFMVSLGNDGKILYGVLYTSFAHYRVDYYYYYYYYDYYFFFYFFFFLLESSWSAVDSFKVGDHLL